MISYKPLKKLMIDADVNSTDLKNDLSIGTNTIAKLNNDNGYVALGVIDKIANYLTIKLDRNVKIDEILEFIPDSKTD